MLRNKSGRRIEAALAGDSYDGTEDLLTASVFSRLSYLDESCLRSVLASLCPTIEWPDAGRLLQVHFWPRYLLLGRTVEPDVVFEFDRLSIWIEAKRWDGLRMQSADQLRAQFQAMRSHEHPDRKVIQLAIGGLGKFGDAELAMELGQLVQPASWEQLAKAVERTPAEMPECARILGDIIAALRLHGVYPEPIVEMGTLVTAGLVKKNIAAWRVNEKWASLSVERLSVSHIGALR